MAGIPRITSALQQRLCIYLISLGRFGSFPLTAALNRIYEALCRLLTGDVDGFKGVLGRAKHRFCQVISYGLYSYEIRYSHRRDLVSWMAYLTLWGGVIFDISLGGFTANSGVLRSRRAC